MECELVTSYAPKNDQKFQFSSLVLMTTGVGDKIRSPTSLRIISDAHYHSKPNTIKYYLFFSKNNYGLSIGNKRESGILIFPRETY